ncbi:MAG: SPOR domain-containing protein [Betaproteobacteria bacterium]|nr:SPOR domain-containing protein [Betaproteobacteria bacterium]
MKRRKIAFSSDLRQTALKRAGIAITVALVLLFAVLWFGDENRLLQLPLQSVTSALKGDTPVLPDSGMTADNEPVEPPLSTDVDTDVETEKTTTPPEPPKDADTPKALQTATNMPAAPPADASVKSISLPEGYFVQLGVFNDTENVAKMFETVTALGMPAHVQSRVVVGPFRDKREADAARERLKDIAEGIVLPPQKKTTKPSGKPKAKPKSRQRAK